VEPEISVVVPTHNRPTGLAALISALRAQAIDPAHFEVVVVDDGSEPTVLVEAEGLELRVLRHERPRGPAAARNAGWRAARGSHVAFIDDDCVPCPGWVGAIRDMTAGDDDGNFVIQGPVRPPPEQAAEVRPLSHTISVEDFTRRFVTANIVYARALLERTGGFDETFMRSAEDVELGARVLRAGAETRFSEEAVVHHEVRQPGLLDLLRFTLRWTDSVRAVSMHPELRDLLFARVF
jgi:glycosyltransferase involved in cell wall biosynthesis